MPLILNIETSSPVCSVCLARDGKLLDFREDQQGTSHAKLLTVFIDELFKSNHLSFAQLDAVAVSAGPGSYTGLRIGASVAKGLCYALDKPLLAVPTLLSLMYGIKQKAKSDSGYYMPAMDARRMDIYTALYDANGKEVMPVTALTIDKTLEEKIIQHGEIFIGGNGTEKCKSIFTSSNIHFVDGVDCDSKMMAPLSEAKYNRGEFESVAYFEPFYLKEFGAKT